MRQVMLVLRVVVQATMQMTIEWFAICVIKLVRNVMICTLKTVLHAITPNFCTRICVFNHAQEDTMNLSMLLI